MPKQITHELRLRDVDAPLGRFLGEAGGLEQKFGAILVQLPPSLAFDQQITADFLSRVWSHFDGLLVIEPRHSSWFTVQAAEMLSRSKIDLVVADPPPCPGAPSWNEARNVSYFRLHGAPRIYYSDYTEEALAALAHILKVSSMGRPSWCIFDNTAASRATANALTLRRRLASSENCP